MHTGIRPNRVMARLTPVLVVALLVAACSGGSSSGVKITDPWARTAPKTAGAGAAYMVIENTGSTADALVGGKSDIVGVVEVHETYEMSPAPDASAAPMASTGMASPAASGMPAASMGTGGAMMGMRPIPKLAIPAGGKVELKPGSYHIMLIDLTRALTVGETIEITLTFEKAGDIKVSLPVRDQ